VRPKNEPSRETVKERSESRRRRLIHKIRSLCLPFRDRESQFISCSSGRQVKEPE